MYRKATKAELIEAISKQVQPGQTISFLEDKHILAFTISNCTDVPLTPLQFIGEQTYWADVRMANASVKQGRLTATFAIHYSQWTL